MPSYVQSSAGLVDTTGAWSEQLTGVTVGNLIAAVCNADGATADGTQTLGTCTGLRGPRRRGGRLPDRPQHRVRRPQLAWDCRRCSPVDCRNGRPSAVLSRADQA